MAIKLRSGTRLSAGDRRKAILAAARSVFGSAGYHAATTREVAAAARVSEALLYQHFDGKRQLFEAVIQAAADDLEQRLAGAARAADPLPAALSEYFDFVEREEGLYRVFFRQALQADPVFEGLYQRFIGRVLELCEASLGAAASVPPERRDIVSHALVGMVSELGLWWLEDRRCPKPEMIARAARMGRAIYTSEAADD